MPASRERDCPLKVAVELPHRKRVRAERRVRMPAAAGARAGLPKIVGEAGEAALLQRRALHANFLPKAMPHAEEPQSVMTAVLPPLRPSGAEVVAIRAKSFAELAVEQLCSPAAPGACWAAVGEAVPRQMPMVRGRAP